MHKSQPKEYITSERQERQKCFSVKQKLKPVKNYDTEEDRPTIDRSLRRSGQKWSSMQRNQKDADREVFQSMDSEVFKRRRFLPADLKPLEQSTIEVERSTELAPGRIKKQRQHPHNPKIKANVDPYGLARK